MTSGSFFSTTAHRSYSGGNEVPWRPHFRWTGGQISAGGLISTGGQIFDGAVLLRAIELVPPLRLRRFINGPPILPSSLIPSL
ncbi:hypothetical protein M6B38_101100 [Iris pallida]|uniref:Uncharacterized protein n=1 Tax=Iris pallida TaxID=29817 RepID=A0AAX6IKT4_IRIPA|nr:hypothetical protein M6B38_101100 [Iris pallida]